MINFNENPILKSISLIFEHRENLFQDTEKQKIIKKNLLLLEKFFELDRPQSILFSLAIADQLLGESNSIKRSMKTLGFESLMIMQASQFTLELRKKGWVEFSDRRGGSRRDEIQVSKKVIDAVKTGDKSKLFQHANLTLSEVILELRNLISRMSDMPEIEDLLENFSFELSRYEYHDFILEIKQQSGLKEFEVLLLIWVISEFIFGNEEVNLEKTLYNLTSDFPIIFWFQQWTSQGNSNLFNKNYLKYKDGHFNDMNTVELGSALEHVMEQLTVLRPQKNKTSSTCKVIEPQNISEQTLFFNEDVKNSITKLNRLISEESYLPLMSQLKENGMQSALTILLYGPPGTGKTELVKQLCKEHGRLIYQVEISEIREMWVGQSEKNLKKVFLEYAQIAKVHSKVPVLLFNEADSLIGKRIHVQSSLDQMSNALQNILLQELEDFSGIFVATTNLIDNIDPAFDRRFLFKQQLNNPDQHTRLQILQHQFPAFPNSDLDIIAQEYDLTGSQIQSIKKKVFVDQLLDLTETTSRNLEQYAKSEISFRNSTSKIGFKSS